MKQIYIFTEDYHDILVQKLPYAVPHNFGGLDCLATEDDDRAVAGLAEIAEQITGESDGLEAKFNNFLQENKYIHLDAFIRICLEDVYA